MFPAPARTALPPPARRPQSKLIRAHERTRPVIIAIVSVAVSCPLSVHRAPVNNRECVILGVSEFIKTGGGLHAAAGAPGALTAASSAFAPRGGAGGGAAAAPCGMEAGVAAPAPAAARTRPAPAERSPARAGLHVNFSDKGEVKERREKFLTAKYGSHQMALIRKRLAVEMWLYDELQKLYDVPKEAAGGAGAQEVDVDVDELLDMDSDELRRAHLAALLADAKKPQKDVHKFINELLDKAKTL